MGAAAVRVQEMVSEDRIMTLESDVKRVIIDTGEIKGSVRALEGNVKVLEGKFEVLDGKVQTLDSKVGALDGKVQVLDSKVHELGRKVDGLEEKVDGVIVAFHSFKTEVAKEFGALRELMRMQIGELRTELWTEIGQLRTEIGQLRVDMGELRAELLEKIGNVKLWVLITIAGSVASLVSMALSIATFVHGWKSP